MSIYDYSYTSIEGRTILLSDYKDKVILIVNTASKCGFTPQYEGLEDLYRKYGEQGLVVIGFPSNQFKEQEPGSNDEVHEFCKLRFGVTFPLSAKIDVRGEDADPIYKFLEGNTVFEGMGSGFKNKAFETMLKAMYGKSFHDSSVKWNFTKFLLGRDGEIIGRYEPTVEPRDIASAIETSLLR